MVFKSCFNFIIVNITLFHTNKGFFFFSILQLLGCHGPLARRQPGRAFLDAIA
jgi:hypothetical protein